MAEWLKAPDSKSLHQFFTRFHTLAQCFISGLFAEFVQTTRTALDSIGRSSLATVSDCSIRFRVPGAGVSDFTDAFTKWPGRCPPSAR